MKKHTYSIRLIFLLSCCFSTIYSDPPLKGFSKVVADQNPLKVLTPSLKDVATRKLILSNNIKVLLISDKDSVRSAASVSVSAGSWNDPVEYPGMAHFCEHMLFMGSKKYPGENDFSQFIHDHGGSNNAYTKSDRTVYAFSINHEDLDQSVDMFSRFFIDPLFSQNSIKRELLAVNQEHNKNVENDMWRRWFIFKQEGNQKHPNAKFSTGTEETLKVISRQDLESWYKKNYHSDGTIVVIYSKQDLDKLTTLVENTFGEIEFSAAGDKPIVYSKLSSPNQEGHITYIEPIKDIKQLQVTWEIPPAYARDLDKKSYLLIGYSLSHDLEGGLNSILKKEGLIEDFYFSCFPVSKDHLLLSFSLTLTDEGVLKTDHILYTFFQALNKIKLGNIPAHIYHDMQASDEIDYKWQSRQNPFSMVMDCADMLMNEELATFPYKSVTINEFDPKNSRDLLAFLTPQNAMYCILANKEATHRTCDKTEQWMGAKYCVSKINNDILTTWSSADPHKDICLPNPNPYISKHQKLLNEEFSETLLPPALISKEEGSCCYFWQDNHYLVPKAMIKVGLKAPAINLNPKSQCLADIYCQYLSDHMASIQSEGAFAGIQSSISAQDLALNISVEGFDDKIGSYMMAYLSRITSFYPTKREFDLVKSSIISSCNSKKRSLPIAQGFSLLNSLISNNNLDIEKKLEVYRSITIEDLQFFHKNIITDNYLQVVIGGNIDEKNALIHYSEVKSTLGGRPYPLASHSVAQYLPFYTSSPKAKKVSFTTTMSGNSAILLIDQGKFTYNNYASHKVLSSIMSDAFFDELRTKQQTGYIASSRGQEYQGTLIQTYSVQSTTHYPEELLARFDLFLEEYERKVEANISKERFETVRQSIINNAKKPSTNLIQHMDTLYSLAFTYEGEFDRKEKLLSALSELSYESFIKDAKLFISRKNHKRLAILVTGSEMDQNSFSYKETTPKDLAAIHQ